MAKTYKGLREDTKKLIDGPETKEVDFKRDSINNKKITLKQDALVAFANSKNGGTLLFGIDEIKGKNGEQKGKVYGCDISDSTITGIENKAQDCIPPIHIDISIENTDSTQPIIRIDIPSSRHKPHCTSSGTYSGRLNNRTGILEPKLLLDVFLKSDGEYFAKNYLNATSNTHELIQLLLMKIHNVDSTIDKVDITIEEIVGRLEDDDMPSHFEDIEDRYLDDIYRFTKVTHDDTFNSDVTDRISDLERTNDAIMHKLGIENPNKKKILNKIAMEGAMQLMIDKKIIRGMSWDELVPEIISLSKNYKEEYKSIPRDEIENRISETTKMLYKDFFIN